MKSQIEWLIFESEVSNYRISKETGIPQSTLSDYFNGKTDIGRMPLDTAIKLYDYFKEVVRMFDKQHGTVKFEGKEYTLTQDAYIDSDFRLGYERAVYEANAIDQDCNVCRLIWIPKKGYEELEDASDHCDWDNPAEVIEL